jgi:hypothetical protein
MAGSVTGLNTFGSQAGPIPLSELDTNFSDITGAVNTLNTYSNYYADAGSVNAMAVTIPSTQTFALTAGLQLQVKVLFTNTGPVTLNVNSTGAILVLGSNGLALIANELLAGSIVTVIYNGSTWQVVGTAQTVTQLIAGSNVILSPTSGTGTVTINATAASGNLYYPIVSEETTAGVTPTAYQYPVGDIRRYGADSTGVNSCTSAINQAIAVCCVGVTYTTIYFDGIFKFTPTSLSWPSAPVAKTTWLVNGILNPTTTISIFNYFQIVGTGGSSPGEIQFQKGATCKINAPSGTIPVIKVTSSSDQVLQNIDIEGAYQGIYFDGANQLGALAKITNVNINVTQAGGSCIYINAFFWIWFENCTFNAGNYSGSNSIYVTNTSTSYSQAGLLFWKDCISSGNGISFSPSTGMVGNARFVNHAHEALPNGATFFYANGGNVSNVEFENLSISDLVGSGYIFDLNGMVNFTISGYPNYMSSTLTSYKSYAYGQIVNDEPQYDYLKTTRNIGSTVVSAYGNSRGAVNARLLNRGLDGGPVLGLGKPIPVTISAGTTGNVVITGSQYSPDGTQTAYLIHSNNTGTGYDTVSALSSSQTIYNGDIIIFGAFVKPVSPSFGAGGSNSALSIAFYPPSGVTFSAAYSGNSNYVGLINGWDNQIYDSGWIPVYGWLQAVSGASSGVTSYVGFTIGIYANCDYYIWSPWVRILPASLGFTSQDATKYCSAVGNIPPVATGVVAIPRTQTFMTGQGATGSRPSASAVGAGAQWFDTTLNIPIWSNGTAWVNAAGTTV